MFEVHQTATDLPIDQQTQISFLEREFNSSAITAAFSMLIGKVAGATPMAFFPLPSKKEDLINNSYAWSMILSQWWLIMKRSVTGMWKNIQTLNIFLFCWLLSFKSKYSYSEYFYTLSYNFKKYFLTCNLTFHFFAFFH